MKHLLTPIVKTILRTISKSPKCFRALQTILVTIATLLGIIDSTRDMIHYPDVVLHLANESGFLSVFVGIFISLLPNNTNTTGAKMGSKLQARKKKKGSHYTDQ